MSELLVNTRTFGLGGSLSGPRLAHGYPDLVVWWEF